MWAYDFVSGGEYLLHYGVKGMHWGVRRQKDGHYEYRLDKMAKGGKLSEMDKLLRTAVETGGVAIKLNRGAQLKHLKGSKNYREDRSYLDGDLSTAQKLFDELHGTGTAVYDKNNLWLRKERVQANEKVGHYRDGRGGDVPTGDLMITYSKKGSHLYPRKKE